MAVIRVNKTKNYTVMSNFHLKEKNMSLKAKGLLSIMFSLPDDWDYSIKGLATLSYDGKDSVMKALKELERFGYLIRTKVLDDQGRFVGIEYNLYEKPLQNLPQAENPLSVFEETQQNWALAEKPNAENPCPENPDPENPDPEKPDPEKPPQLNTKQLSTKQLSTKGINIYDHSEKIRNDRVSESQVNKEFDRDIDNEIKNDEADNGIVVSNSVNKEQKNIVTAKQLRNDFEALWALYPRKQGKKTALAAYSRAVKNGTSFKQIESGIKAYVEYIKVRKVSQEYIKQGSTFFSQNAWEDEWECKVESYDRQNNNIFEQLYEESKKRKEFIDCEVNEIE